MLILNPEAILNLYKQNKFFFFWGGGIKKKINLVQKSLGQNSGKRCFWTGHKNLGPENATELTSNRQIVPDSWYTTEKFRQIERDGQWNLYL